MTFDPEKCDHGALLMGRTQWDWCENCRPDLYRITAADLQAAVQRLRDEPISMFEPRVRILTPSELVDDDEIASVSALNDPTWRI